MPDEEVQTEFLNLIYPLNYIYIYNNSYFKRSSANRLTAISFL